MGLEFCGFGNRGIEVGLVVVVGEIFIQGNGREVGLCNELFLVLIAVCSDETESDCRERGREECVFFGSVIYFDRLRG